MWGGQQIVVIWWRNGRHRDAGLFELHVPKAGGDLLIVCSSALRGIICVRRIERPAYEARSAAASRQALRAAAERGQFDGWARLGRMPRV